MLKFDLLMKINIHIVRAVPSKLRGHITEANLLVVDNLHASAATQWLS